MRPSRLFLKLFLAFWAATSLSFFVAIGLLQLINREPGSPPGMPGAHAAFISESAAKLIQHGHLNAARQLLRWAQLPGYEVALFDASATLLEGSDIAANPSSERWVETTDRRAYRLVTNQAARTGRLPSLPLIIGTVISLLFSATLAWYLSRPLLLMGEAFQAIAQGQLGTRVKPLMGNRRDEIVDLGNEFDRMATQLQQLVGAQQRLLHDISHELRSPLTRMQAAIGLLRQWPDQRDAMLARIERESERLDRLIDEVLTLARLEAGADSAVRERVDLIELIGDIAEDASFEAETKGCTVQIDAQGQFVSHVSGELLYRAFENVVRNAVKFTRPATVVRLVTSAETTAQGQTLRVRVEDGGPGVPSDMLEAIFAPFKRTEGNSESGFGLGLAIARRALEMHGGGIRASLSPDGNLVVEMWVPQIESPT